MHGETMWISMLLTLIIVGTATCEVDNHKFPFCKLCICASNKGTTEEKMDVTCTSNIQYHIFNDAFWYKTTNHTTQTKQIVGNKTEVINHSIQTFDSYAYNSINFQNNEFINLTYTFPDSNLTYLNLANNAIYKINESVFMNLQNMRTLILSYNNLEILDPSAFKGKYLKQKLMPLKSLKELRLDHNNLHTLNKDLFEHTTDIEILDLSSNPLEVIDHHTLSAIDGLAFLKELYLQYTGINTLPDNMLHTPKYLEILDLSGNPIKAIPNTLKQAQSLTNLYLNNTEFVNFTEEIGFPELPKLKVLHLCRNQHLSRLQKNSLSGLSGLEELRLSDNIDLVEISPQSLAKHMNGSGGAIWPPIKKLYIGNNKLAYIDSDIIARWDSLSELDIRNNPWTCACDNQWLIEDLMPLYLKIDEEMAKQVRCAAPIEMVRYSFFELYEKKSHMRCLDIYGAQPERDAIILVGLLAGILIAIPSILLIILAYQRKWISLFGICDSSPGAYSRRYYKATTTDEQL